MAQIKKWNLSRSWLIIAGISLGQFSLWVSPAAGQQGNIELRMQDIQQSLCPDMQKFVVTVVDC